ncbi:ROK family transcriptional regulator [Nonomuraea jiangxiensis]|uniref:Sugar kinase of the NBD/HSP70 family, may contain an N-terminal HTH domain n=1 Tax=Nonomuraea jiangxiensis TaxID=633440 RepID=A0A1G8Q1D4_9ACTN|nr:ROK family transcriptional regulator [Nonomuraea jiangxiensis]SDI98513.1 Sugar kinase of the NBD/HSP70 family, may contain an N-terminal HTH domain [Nonomuraea jiangxiensis]
MARRESAAAGPGSRALIVDLIRSSGPISRVELVEATGLTQPTISNIVRRLLDDGVVRETGDTVATGGKPRTMLVINSRSAYGIGIRVGADTLTCVVTDTRGGTIGRELVAVSPTEDVVTQLSDLYLHVTGGLGLAPQSVAGLAVVAQGPVDVARGRFLALPGFGHLDLRRALSARLGVPVLVDGDASAAAVGEFWGRQVSRDRTFGCLYMNSGISSGVVLDGALQRGASSNAGEIGHVSVVRDGDPCRCGNRGCLELYAAPAALVSRARTIAGLADRLGIRPNDPVARAFDVLARAAIYGDEQARVLVEESAALLADGALTLANLWDLDTLVLAGPGFAVAGSLYVSEIRRRLGERTFSRRIHAVQVDLSSNPRDSAAIGGAALVLQGSVAPGHGPQVAAPQP